MKRFEELKEEFLKLGGNPKILTKIPTYSSIKSEARLLYEIGKLRGNTPSKSSKPLKTVKKVSQSVQRKSNSPFADPISFYPQKLHEIYLKGKNEFLIACSLKTTLNQVPEWDVGQALNLQIQIMNCFEVVDNANRILTHYKEKNIIIPQKSNADFSNLSKSECILKRNRIRSNIVARRKTIEKQESQLKKAHPKNKLRLQDKLNKKILELEEMKLQIVELNQIINKEI